MKSRLPLFLPFFFLLLLLAGCQPNAYKQVSTSLKIRYHDETFTPLLWHVPGGEKITMEVNNETDQEWHWILMARPVTLPFDADDWQETLVEFTIPAGTAQTFTFTAPQAAGEYDVVCDLDLTEEKPGPVGTLVVYRIRELTTTPY